ncbi:hypothetical protein H0H81_007169 [Sphagnurus paluster]|uniref:WD40 repeat-like protein n=1 Tax=Sphagnurus paluster TaxID=117069 RepID=A0A9P7GWF6_9AGAR|nr:hypothetical protein H0H81_007169 [Sphagnurus paluster]
MHDWALERILNDHPFSVGCLAWSKDDSILLTSADNFIQLWDTRTGECKRRLEQHSDTVTALAWLPDGSGFISGGLDYNILHWDADGNLRDKWAATSIRVTDLAITPDFARLVTVGMHQLPVSIESLPGRDVQSGDAAAAGAAASRASENRMIIYDLATKQVESTIRLDGELTSVKVSQDSRFALINHAPDEIHLWDLDAARLSRKFTGQKQGRHVIRSCFGGHDGNFVVSGSEGASYFCSMHLYLDAASDMITDMIDGNVYVWHRDTGTLVEVLSGHGEGSVNSVAWNPQNYQMFASCSDDHTIRIWEAPPEMMIEESLPAQSFAENGNGKGKTRQRWDGEGLEI